MQRLVQRVGKISSFYIKENIELYDISQKVSLMTNDCQEMEDRFEVLDRKFKEIAKKVEEYQKQQRNTNTIISGAE